MTISGAISNAVSGLTAVARGTQVVSSNLSNALTPGYARREVGLSAQTHQNVSGGVRVDGINRAISNAVLSSMRLASAASGEAGTRANYAAQIERLFGTSAENGSLGAQVANFDKTLIEAASRPDTEVRLTAAVSAAHDLIKSVNAISDGIHIARTDADRQIAAQVQTLNTSLAQAEALNRKIAGELARSGDASSLMDERQKIIDSISSILPIKELPRGDGRIALFTQNGQPLLDGSEPVRIGFTPAGVVSPEMTLEDGSLSGLTLDGETPSAIQTASLKGGSLSALFDFRDKQAVSAQEQIDAFALELYDRFSDADLDTSLTPGAPGLFTDSGGTLTEPAGLAGRLAINPLLDTNQDGAVWRLRDGMGAAAPGSPGDSALLTRLSARLNESRPPINPTLGPSGQSMTTLAGVLMSHAASARVSADAANVRASANHGAMTQAVLAEGVDTDHEMQNLLLLEKAYAANARVIQSAFDMLDTILRIRT